MISVVICTFNPRPDYFASTLAALNSQTLQAEEWELVVVDNCSNPPVVLPTAGIGQRKLVVENQPGLTPARLRGIKECMGDLIVFVDDDNVLHPEYLAEAQRLAKQRPELGAFGGTASVIYEQDPEPNFRCLADSSSLYRPLKQAQWSNLYLNDTTPFGAGLCVRKTVAEAYAKMVSSDPIRRSLDKVGDQILLCGDTDLAWTAVDMGLGCGVFPELQFDHLISAKRVSPRHLLREVEGFSYSWLLLHRLRRLPLNGILSCESLSQKALWWWSYLRQSPVARAISMARRRGQARAAAVLLPSGD